MYVNPPAQTYGVTEDYRLVGGDGDDDCINTNIPGDGLTREVMARYTAVWHMDENRWLTKRVAWLMNVNHFPLPQ